MEMDIDHLLIFLWHLESNILSFAWWVHTYLASEPISREWYSNPIWPWERPLIPLICSFMECFISWWPLPHPTFIIISLSRNWLTSKVSEHSPCNGQASAFRNAKGKLSNDQNPFSFLIKYFYNPHKFLQGRIHSHRIPPTHHWYLVTSMTLVLLINPLSSSKFELLPPNPKCTLL